MPVRNPHSKTIETAFSKSTLKRARARDAMPGHHMNEIRFLEIKTS